LQKRLKGFTNLIAHIKSGYHEDWKTIARDALRKKIFTSVVRFGSFSAHPELWSSNPRGNPLYEQLD
jgi:hypothetical protein